MADTTMDSAYGLGDELIAKIAAILCAEIQSQLSEKKWKIKDPRWNSAYVDIRWTIDGNTRIAKLRVELANGRVFPRLHVPIEAKRMFDTVWEMREKTDNWFGLNLTVFPGGTSELTYNRDPECSCDPTFFDPV